MHPQITETELVPVPAEAWLIVYWDPVAQDWVTGSTRPAGEEQSARALRDLYRAELGTARVRMLHTADG